MAPENEAFRLGIQKCHNTIQDNVKDGEVFNVPGASILFRMLCSAQEMHSDSSGVHKMKRAPTLKGLLTNMAIKKEEKGPDGCETGGKTLGIYLMIQNTVMMIPFQGSTELGFLKLKYIRFTTFGELELEHVWTIPELSIQSPH